ncbi:MAG: DUF1523 family protein [Thiohalocapsa sp.]|uniref:DUF1523 family protein n=1 Tax=Thiohalocapsa sp. TaxID=2497641 RepID=UPI0025F2F450|nr:DUF1523 family protein [Thiohalocapsa sp.]MCG6943412.1 DUF1523 family protein [Thiohalocapsa sp.]
MKTKNKFTIGIAIVAVIVVGFVWLRWGPDTWNVQITGVTGDGRNVQYRIETVHAGSADTLIFRNEDTGFMPPYLKFDSARVQSIANRITRECPKTEVAIHGYGFRIPWLNMFPNAVSIHAPKHCLTAPSGESTAQAARK